MTAAPPRASRYLLLDADGARAALTRGVDLMTGLVAPTLGPVPRTVAVARMLGTDPPEMLDSGATITRRTIELADPFEDMGAKLIRHLTWAVYERCGDGTATAAVLAQAVLHEAGRYLAAGGNPVAVRRGLEHGLAAVLAALRAQARPVDLPGDIAAVIAGELGDPELADTVSQIVEAVGADGSIVVENAEATTTGYEFFDGIRWDEGYISSFLLGEAGAAIRLVDPCVFITNYDLTRAEDLLPAVEACLARGKRSLFVIASEVRDAAVGLLIVNRERGVLDGAIAVRAPSYGTGRLNILEDIAIATGARCVTEERHDLLSAVTATDLGSARQAWANRFRFALLGPRGDKNAIRWRIAEINAELRTIVNDQNASNRMRERIGRLSGTGAAIRVGAPTQGEQEALKLRVESAVKAARFALESGVVAGGGAALLACVDALADVTVSAEEAMGVRVLAHALRRPMVTILTNAGLEPAPIVDEARRRGPPWLFDAIGQGWVDAFAAGIVDPVEVVAAALETGVTAAATALTAGALVHRRSPPLSWTP